MKPEAGQWWFPDVTQPNDTASGRAVFIKSRLNDEQLLIQPTSNYFAVWKDNDFKEWHHEPRCTGWDWVVPDQPEDPDEWVIQDKVPVRAEQAEQAEQWPKYYTTIDSPSSDVAFVKRVDETSYSVVYKNGRECPGFLWVAKNESRRKQLTEAEAMALLNPTSNAYFSYHEKHKTQPQKTRVKLWKWKYGAECRLADISPSGDWVEVHHDSEGFYVEG